MADPSLPGYPQNSFGLVRCPDEPRKVLYSFVSRRESRWKGTCRLLRRLPQSWWLSSETTISGTMYTPIMASLQRRFVRWPCLLLPGRIAPHQWSPPAPYLAVLGLGRHLVAAPAAGLCPTSARAGALLGRGGRSL